VAGAAALDVAPFLSIFNFQHRDIVMLEPELDNLECSSVSWTAA
jgi:hypothetical protein